MEPTQAFRPDYPGDLERWWLAQARGVSGYAQDSATLDFCEPAVRRLSELFTTGRTADFGNYADHPRLLLAYGLFFFPQTFIRAQWVLREWWRTLENPVSEGLALLDLGCGTGAATAAALHFLNRFAPGMTVRAHGLDASASSLRRMTLMLRDNQALWPRGQAQVAPGSLMQLPGPDAPAWDVMIASFALNEVFEQADESAAREWLSGLLRRLKPGGRLLVVEPAGRAPSPRLERLRDWAIQNRVATVPAPCLHAAPCPLLARGDDLWCHEVRTWRIPDSIRHLNRTLRRTVEDVKFSFLILAPPSAPAPAGDATRLRMIAPMHKAKGRIVTQGCAADGAAREYEILTRHLDRQREKTLMDFERGDILRADNPQPLASGNCRVAGLQQEE